MTPIRHKNTGAREASGFYASDWKPGLTLQSGYPKDGPCPGCGVTIRKNAPNHKCSECRKGRRKATVQPSQPEPEPAGSASTLRYLVTSDGKPVLTCHPMPLAKADAAPEEHSRMRNHHTPSRRVISEEVFGPMQKSLRPRPDDAADRVPLSPLSDLDLAIENGWGDTPQHKLPADWRTRRKGRG